MTGSVPAYPGELEDQVILEAQQAPGTAEQLGPGLGRACATARPRIRPPAGLPVTNSSSGPSTAPSSCASRQARLSRHSIPARTASRPRRSAPSPGAPSARPPAPAVLPAVSSRIADATSSHVKSGSNCSPLPGSGLLMNDAQCPADRRTRPVSRCRPRPRRAGRPSLRQTVTLSSASLPSRILPRTANRSARQARSLLNRTWPWVRQNPGVAPASGGAAGDYASARRGDD